MLAMSLHAHKRLAPALMTVVSMEPRYRVEAKRKKMSLASTEMLSVCRILLQQQAETMDANRSRVEAKRKKMSLASTEVLSICRILLPQQAETMDANRSRVKVERKKMSLASTEATSVCRMMLSHKTQTMDANGRLGLSALICRSMKFSFETFSLKRTA